MQRILAGSRPGHVTLGKSPQTCSIIVDVPAGPVKVPNDRKSLEIYFRLIGNNILLLLFDVSSTISKEKTLISSWVTRGLGGSSLSFHRQPMAKAFRICSLNTA